MAARIAFLLSLTISLVKAQSAFPDFEVQQHVTATDTLGFRLLRPASMEAGKKYPLVLFLHGMGERGNDNEIHLKHIAPLFLDSTHRTQYPCFVIAPQCPLSGKWTYPDWHQETKEPMLTVVDLLKVWKDHPQVDSSRIYVTGLSMGGYGTWYLLTRYPDFFAAAAPICGGGDASRVEAFKHIPVWVFHGAKDDVVPVAQSRDMVKALRKAGAKPRYSEYRQVNHESWVPAYQERDFLPWLFSHSR
jgi:predicted peptidase